MSLCTSTAPKMKFSIKDFFNKCDQIRSFLRIWSHLLKKSLIENFNFCAVIIVKITFLNFFSELNSEVVDRRYALKKIFTAKHSLHLDGVHIIMKDLVWKFTKIGHYGSCFPVSWLTDKNTYHQDRHLQYPGSVFVLLAWNYRIHYLLNLLNWSNFSGKTCIFDLAITWYFQNLENKNSSEIVLVMFRLAVSKHGLQKITFLTF